MAIEMPEWCGACDPLTRRFNLGDLEKRCPDCHPYWAFGHSSIDPTRVPATRLEQERAARWLMYEMVSLRALAVVELRRRTRAFFEQGWTPLDVIHALDFDPDGSRVRAVASTNDSADLLERRVLNLLSSWCDEHGRPLPSPSQQAAARNRRLRERQRLTRAKLAEIASRPPNPQGSARSGARQVAAEAIAKGRALKAEGRRREQAALDRQQSDDVSYERRVQQTMRQLDKFRFGVLSGSSETAPRAKGDEHDHRAVA